MMDTISCKGYVAGVELDADENCLRGRVLGIRDVVSFSADTVPEMKRRMAEAVDDYLDYCRERGVSPERPFSGRFLVRIGQDLHRDAALAAQRSGASLNAWVAGAMRSALDAERTSEAKARDPKLALDTVVALRRAGAPAASPWTAASASSIAAATGRSQTARVRLVLTSLVQMDWSAAQGGASRRAGGSPHPAENEEPAIA